MEVDNLIKVTKLSGILTNSEKSFRKSTISEGKHGKRVRTLNYVLKLWREKKIELDDKGRLTIKGNLVFNGITIERGL